MPYVDLNTIHNPATGLAPPASWGDAVRDNFDHFNSLLDLDAGTVPAVPTVLQNVVVAKTVVFTRYIKQGRKVTGWYHFNTTSAGTAGHRILVTTPMNAAQAGNLVVGAGYHFIPPSLNIPFLVVQQAVGNFGFVYTGPSNDYYGVNPVPLPQVGAATTSQATTLASGHALLFYFCFESAS